MTTSSTATEVTLELTELKRLGVKVTRKQLAYPVEHPTEMDEYHADGMSISDIADLVRELY